MRTEANTGTWPYMKLRRVCHALVRQVLGMQLKPDKTMAMNASAACASPWHSRSQSEHSEHQLLCQRILSSPSPCPLDRIELLGFWVFPAHVEHHSPQSGCSPDVHFAHSSFKDSLSKDMIPHFCLNLLNLHGT